MNRIIEILMLEKLLKSNLCPNTTTFTNCFLKCHNYSFSELVQGWWLHHFLGSPFQCLNTLSVKKSFLISNLHLHWHNLKPFPLVLLIVAWKKRLMCSISTASFLWPCHPTWCHLQLDWPQNWALGDSSCVWRTGFHTKMTELISLARLMQELGIQS